MGTWNCAVLFFVYSSIVHVTSNSIVKNRIASDIHEFPYIRHLGNTTGITNEFDTGSTLHTLANKIYISGTIMEQWRYRTAINNASDEHYVYYIIEI